MEKIISILNEFEYEMYEENHKIALERAVERFKQNKCEEKAIGEILKTIEKYPDYDWGTPGAFGHYMEVYINESYPDLLLESYLRKPTENTAFLLFRLATQTDDKQVYCDAYKKSLLEVKDQNLKEHIKEYIAWLD